MISSDRPCLNNTSTMHFSVPDIQELKEGKANKSYVGYNVYANGTFHCVLRYKQFHSFHEQLKRDIKLNSLPYFPPKKLWPINQVQVEERRNSLEKYLQIISQDERINKSDFFNGFLLQAQQETHNATRSQVDIDIYLIKPAFKFCITVFNTDNSSSVLESATKHLELPSDLVSYFSLYLVRKTGKDDRDIDCIIERKMMNFESPYLTLRNFLKLSQEYCLVIRKSYWDPAIDDIIMKNPISLRILYDQVVSDVEKGWLATTMDVEKQLESLQTNDSDEAKEKYIRLAKTLKFYGYIQLETCTSDYPSPNTRAIVRAGGKELVIATSSPNEKTAEHYFKVTRIRCWRLTTCAESEVNPVNSDLPKSLKFELSFEYLFSKNCLKWITIKADQSILLSIFLRSMVEELLVKRDGLKIHSSSNGLSKTHPSSSTDSWYFMKRDSSSNCSNISKSSSSDSIPRSESSQQLRKSCSINGKFSKARSLVENDAFDAIDDDDL